MTESDRIVVAGNRTERAFYRWGAFVVRHRFVAFVLPVLLTCYLASWLPLLALDNSTEAMLRKDDPTAIRYSEFRDLFDRDDRIIIALNPKEVFSPAFLKKLREFHLALERELPYVEDVTSLFNARWTYGEGDQLFVGDLLDGWLDRWPEEAPDLANLRSRVLANPLYVDNLISADAGFTTVTLKPFTYSTLGPSESMGASIEAGFSESDASSDFGVDPRAEGEPDSEPEKLTSGENDELMDAVHRVIERFASEEFPIYLGGPLVVTDHINRNMATDFGKFMGMSIGMIFLLLFVLFRRISGMLLPLSVVLLSVVSAIGLMIVVNIPGSTAVQILPIFLLTVGVCDAVHILAIVYQRLALDETREEAIAYAVGHSGLAVVMTSVTTAAGMVSFLSAELAPIAQLGLIAPVGVMLALAYTLILLPAILAMVPLKSLQKRERVTANLTAGLVSLGDFSANHPRKILLGTFAVVVVSLTGASQVRFSHHALEWFSEDDPIKVASSLIDRELRGSMSLEVVLDTGRENGLHDPEVLARIEAAAEFARGVSQGDVVVGKTFSIVDFVKETHQALNANEPSFYRIPEDRMLVAQELLLFENGGADALEEMVDTRFSQARLSLRAPFVDAMAYGPFISELETGINRMVGPEIDVEMTGFMPVLAGVISAVIVSMTRSYAIALLIITPLMILLLRDLRLGLISMIPNLVPVVFILGLMGWADIALDGSTIMMGAMIIGLAVDDTIHFMHKFRIYFEASGDARLAIRETLSTTGAALLFTSLVLSAGFYTMGMASMVNTRSFGALMGTAALVAFLADVLIAPALMVVTTRRTGRD